MKIQFEKNAVRSTLCKAISCGLIPILSCILYCAFRGQSLKSIYLPNTACSDDIFYYKMVEGIVNFGAPLGYFGYNESHAMISSFGAWSPILLLPWALWGKIFGWEYYSPIACNICIMSCSFVFFAVLSKPKWKQVISIALLFLLFTPCTRYVLSGMPEAICYSLIIIVYGIVYGYFKNENRYKLISVFLLVTILSLMRPYFMIFLLLPGMLWVRRAGLKGGLGTAAIILFNLMGYKFITHFFTAPYFYNSMATDFIDSFKCGGFFEGCIFLLHKLYDKWMTIRRNMSLGVRQGFTDGQIYAVCCTAMLLLSIWLLADFIKMRNGKGKNRNIIDDMILESSQLVSFAAMLFAIMILYQIPEGSRHILVFLVAFIIVGAMKDEGSFEKIFLSLIVFAFLFVYKYDVDSGYHVPYSREDVVREVEGWNDMFSACISLEHENVPSSSNVVDWVIADVVDGKEKEIPWKVLFALPEGTGISCCVSQYVADNIEELNSRYIITVSNGQIDLLCQKKEMDMLFRNEYFALYRNN